MPVDRFLRIRQVQNLVPYSRSMIYLLESRGEFPRRRPLGGRAVAWLESEISEWIAARAALKLPARAGETAGAAACGSLGTGGARCGS